MGLVDGLGFEEVNQSGLSTNLVQTVSGVHTRTSSTTYVDNNGAIVSNSVGSPATYGALVQAGKAGPLLAATGSIVFGRQFADQTFVTTVTPSESGTLPWSVASGTTTYTVSGITVNGQSGLSFHWVAVGL